MFEETTQEQQEEEKRKVRDILSLPVSTEIEFNDIGWTSRIYMIEDGRYIVKFPRREEVKKEYAREVACLKLISTLDCQVTFPKLISSGEKNEYTAYEGVLGKPVSDCNGLSFKEFESIGRALGDFVSKFSLLTLPEAQVQDPKLEFDWLKDSYQKGEGHLAKNFSSNQLKVLSNFAFEKFEKEINSIPEVKVLAHGDLGYWNMIYGGNGKLGIIDFGDVGIFDESKDFSCLHHRPFFDSAVNKFGASDLLKKKAMLRMQSLPLIELPYFLDKGDQTKIEEVIDLIQKLFFQTKG